MTSHTSNLAKTIALTLFRNAHSRKPLTGVPELYRRLHAGFEGTESNPFFYISSSSWNIYDLIEDFIRLKGLPTGAIMLRDFGIDRHKFIVSDHSHKLEKVRRVIRLLPSLPFLLFGDSNQQDPSLYLQIAREFPGRILNIFIHRKVHSSRSLKEADWRRSAKAAGVPFHLIASAYEAQEICIASQLIRV